MRLTLASFLLTLITGFAPMQRAVFFSQNQTVASSGGSAITAVGTPACSVGSFGGATSLSVSYTPTSASNTLSVSIGLNGSAWGSTGTPSFTDNLSNSYATDAVMDQGFTKAAHATRIGSLGGITTITASATGSTLSGVLCVQEYSGGVSLGVVPVEADGNSGTYSGTLASTTGTNSVLLTAVSVGFNATQTISATAGTIRVQEDTNGLNPCGGYGGCVATQDNTAASSGVPLTVSGTISTSTQWAIAGIELKNH